MFLFVFWFEGGDLTAEVLTVWRVVLFETVLELSTGSAVFDVVAGKGLFRCLFLLISMVRFGCFGLGELLQRDEQTISG